MPSIMWCFIVIGIVFGIGIEIPEVIEDIKKKKQENK